MRQERIRVRSISAVALLALAFTLAPGASAAPLVREHYSGVETGTFDDCGFTIAFETTFQGVFMLKDGRRGDPTPYYFDNYNVTEVLTNVATGEWLTITHNGLYKDLRVTQVEGTVYSFVANESGQPFVVRDSAGNVVLRDRGLLRTTFQVDTLGDTDLDNDVFIEDSFELLRDAGSHPGFFIDFCEIMVDVIG